ncbi:aldehyde dehydrogenase family protein [Glutamicibacter arilaitensis]|uniref:aldehyde dehydrogenase family protein n=1 Tax=Glutamicibacter arilaitensis TaxID=256701 RepID=UPI00384C1036
MEITQISTKETIATLVGGKFVTAIDGQSFEARNPSTGELLGYVPRMQRADVDIAVEAAASAAREWGRTPTLKRIALVNALADRIDERREELALLDSKDNGTPLWVTRQKLQGATMFMRYQANLATEVRGETIPDEFDHLNINVHEPYGVTARIMPFNNSLSTAAIKIVPSLVMGNAILIKPSEHTSLAMLELAKDLDEIFPSGLVSVITGFGDEAGAAIVDHPLVRRIAFIGSERVGRAIQERAARAGVKHISLELGGKNPLVIFPDADLDIAAGAAVLGMNFNWQSQSCGSTSRLLVHEEIHDEFVQRVAEKINALKAGNPMDDDVDMGAIVSEQQYKKVLEYIELGKQEGRLVAGGTKPEGEGLENGLFIRPTMFDSIKYDDRIAQEEIFGPVLVAIKFNDYDEAIRIANSTDYGLTASIFTKDNQRAHRFARDIEAGYVWVNTVSRLMPGTPYGGVKGSGVGREGNLEELYSFTTTKNVMFAF